MQSFITQAGQAVGLPEDKAEFLAQRLVENDLRGVFSHGSERMPIYVGQFRGGELKPDPQVRIVQDTPVSLIVDGDGGLGYYPAYEGTLALVEKTKKSGIAALLTRNHGHIGAAGIYARLTLPHDLLCFVTSGHQLGLTSGRPIFDAAGGSPFSFSAPAATEDPLVLDFGTMHDLYASSPYRDEIARKTPGLVFRSIGMGAVCQAWGGLLAGVPLDPARARREYSGANQGSLVVAIQLSLFMPPISSRGRWTHTQVPCVHCSRWRVSIKHICPAVWKRHEKESIASWESPSAQNTRADLMKWPRSSGCVRHGRKNDRMPTVARRQYTQNHSNETAMNPTQPKPNIILIVCDQFRGDCLGADGHPVVQTPNLDYLAACGTRFRHAYSAVPSCIPARATLWTGQNQWHTGILGMGWGQGPVPNDFPHTLAGELTGVGYRTHMIGKGHFSPQRALMGFNSTELDESGRTLVHGFEDEYREWFDRHAPPGVSPDDHGINWNSWLARPWHTEEYLHPSAWTISRALEFLEGHPADRPFFLNISFARPHSPYVPPRPYFDMYLHDATPAPHVGKWAAKHDKPKDAVDPNAWRGRMTDSQVHRARSGYYGEITFIDHQIGRLMNWMDRFRREALARTWIVFASDHGDMQGDHHLWRKTYAYEGSSRIPLLVVPPKEIGRPDRKIADEVVELRDIMPTILDATGLPIPQTVDGASLLPLLDAPPQQWRSYLHGEHCTCYSAEQEMHFVTDGRRKFIWLPRINRTQFFDLETDPAELNDLVRDGRREDEVQLWRERLIDELKNRDCGWVKNGELYCPADEPLISPYKDVRWLGYDVTAQALLPNRKLMKL